MYVCVCCVCVYVETRTEPSQIEELQATQRNELPASASTMHSPVSLCDILSNCQFHYVLLAGSFFNISLVHSCLVYRDCLPSLETSHSRKSDE